MADRAQKTKRRFRPIRWLLGWGVRLLLWGAVAAFLFILAIAVIDPPTTYYMWSEKQRLGKVDHQWVPLEDISPNVSRAVVAAEDANFCEHWGFDMAAIRAAIEDGALRGASTLTQQTVKNVYLWPDRSWLRKALEAILTPGVEAIWPKRRIVEVYLNVAEFDEGVFGIDAAAHHYFQTTPKELSARQSAQLATLLPSPKTRSPDSFDSGLSARADSIADGAATIAKDGRAACFGG